MRAAAGLTAVAEGWAYPFGRDDTALWARAAGLLLIASGALLLVGLLTPFASIMVVLCGVGFPPSGFQATAPHLFPPGSSPPLEVVVTVALVLTGPGAYSLDARLFGRREIIIPHPPCPPRR